MMVTTNLESDELSRRRAANRRVGWCLAAIALAIFLFSMFLRS